MVRFSISTDVGSPTRRVTTRYTDFGDGRAWHELTNEEREAWAEILPRLHAVEVYAAEHPEHREAIEDASTGGDLEGDVAAMARVIRGLRGRS